MDAFVIVWHVGADPVPENVNGVNTTIWRVARGQAALGHEVVLLLLNQQLPTASAYAERAGITLLHVPGRWWFDRQALGRAFRAKSPHIVHMHSVFIPAQAAIAQFVKQRGVPYVVTPHGGVDPNILHRGKLKKAIYGLLFERPRFRGAAAVTALLPEEVRQIDAYVHGHHIRTPVIPNPIDKALLDDSGWKGGKVPVHLAYLGRFDVHHKGLDRLVQIARLLPDVGFDLYGPLDGSAAALAAELKPPRNVVIRPPVYGSAKVQALLQAMAYVQTSRWEALGISVAEAMALGVPCAVMSSMKLAESIEAAGAGLVLSQAPEEAARQLADWLADPTALATCGRRAREFAAVHFSEAAVVSSYLRLYNEILESPRN